MSHGAVIWERGPAGAWLFQFAASQDEGVSFFASANWLAREGARERQSYWDDAFVRTAGRFGPESWDETEHARYQPSWERPFTKMCHDCLVRISHGLAMPLEVTDDEAKQVWGKLHEASQEVIVLLGQEKRPRRPLLSLEVARWAFAVGFTYESYCSIFIARDTEVAARALDAVDRDAQILDRW